MSSTSERSTNEQTRTYDRASSVVFLKTDAPFGGLSNMAGGFPLHVQGTRIYTSEALYQACRFPHLPEVQRLIIGQASPMTAKMKSKPYRKDSRPDWDRVRVKVMRWCLRVKLAQNWAKFSELLLRTDDRPIVEESRRDDFWGAKPVDDRTLVGMNVLGRLLMELREAVKSHGRDAFVTVEPPDIPEFLLLGRPIGAVGAHELGARDAASTSTARAPDHEVIKKEEAEQGSLFGTPAAREGSAPAYITSPTSKSTSLGDLKPYPAMKNSEVPWLGEVPEHWEVRPVGGMGSLFKGNGGNKGDEVPAGIPCVRYGDLYTRHEFFITKSKAYVSKERSWAYTPIRYGDVLFAASGETEEDIGRSSVNLIEGEARCGGDILVLRPEIPAVPRYLGYAADSPASRNQKACMGRGFTVVHIYGSQLKRLLLPLPPLPEQASIVRFLDYVDRRIRRYLRAKQKIIKLLEELKAALIHRAVTGQIDVRTGKPYPAYKPSGVEWLGEVPEHWEVRRLKNWVIINRAVLAENTSNDYEFRYLDIGSVGTGVLTADPKRLRFSAAPSRARRIVREGDTIVSTVRTYLKAVYFVDSHAEDLVCSTGFSVLTPRSCTVPKFVSYFCQSSTFTHMVTADSVGTAYPAIAEARFATLRVAVPPIREQAAIARYLDGKTAEIDKAIEAARCEIALLREFRTCLIADVVTGKLDVREVAARLPDEAEAQEDLEPLDDTEAEAEEAGAGEGEEMPEEDEV